MSAILHSRPFQKAVRLFDHYFLLEQVPGNSLPDLEFSTDVKQTVNKLRLRPWAWYDVVNYTFLSAIFLFVYLIFPASFLIKTPILLLLITAVLVPLTQQFFVYALPILAWLALFFSASKIPHEWKPAISVKFLPAMETILYGDNLSNVLAEINHPILDVLAWLPYGIIHFASPFFVALFVFLFAPPTSLRSFGFAFGYMNLFGVLFQLSFPAAPPWYKNLHGLEPANYAMDGSPGGLGRIDQLFHLDMYTTTFENSPLVFGAIPSLHSGSAVMDVLFLSWLFPKYKYVWWGYATVLWWSTMYLTHHYFIDLIMGAVMSVAMFAYVKYTSLPAIDYTKFCRWSYTSIELFDVKKNDPLALYVGLPHDAEESLGFYNDVELTALRESSNSLSRSQLVMEDQQDADTDKSTNLLIFDEQESGTHISQATSNTSLNDLAPPVTLPKKMLLLR
uniref:Phosphatidic acid phosphatase type 2/haloperoxidase domain-containing protein n=1 Tax=Candidozyma auris TaxID=498019 RepID=A0A0L0NZR7_CANAR